jgi:NADH-quinone oxidoreductase subunit G
VHAAPSPAIGANEAILATWHHLIDLGRLTDGDAELVGTARPSLVRIGKALATQLDVVDGDPVTVGTVRGSVTLPAAVSEMPDDVVWLPTNSPSSTVRRTLGVTSGGVVSVTAGGVTATSTGSAEASDATSRGGNL